MRDPIYYVWFLAAVFLSSSGCYILIRLGSRFAVAKRFGGAAIALVILLLLVGSYHFGNMFDILPKDYGSLALSLAILMIGGLVDDKKNLTPSWQFVFQSLAAGILLWVDDTIDHVMVPGLGLLYFPEALNYVLSFLWIVIIMNAFNWLDGIDGLAGGIGLIGMGILFLLGLTPLVSQPSTAFLAVITGGALLGFLFFNFFPAKIYLGSAGSNCVGMMLAALSVYSGGKVAAAMLVLGLPLIDFVYVSLRRIARGRVPWVGGDREHLHYRLIDSGWSPVKIVLYMYAISAVFGILALTLQTGVKAAALMILVIVFALFVLSLRKEAVSKGDGQAKH